MPDYFSSLESSCEYVNLLHAACQEAIADYAAQVPTAQGRELDILRLGLNELRKAETAILKLNACLRNLTRVRNLLPEEPCKP